MLEYLYRGGEAEGMLTLSGERKTFPARRCGIGTSAELELGSLGVPAQVTALPRPIPSSINKKASQLPPRSIPVRDHARENTGMG